MRIHDIFSLMFLKRWWPAGVLSSWQSRSCWQEANYFGHTQCFSPQADAQWSSLHICCIRSTYHDHQWEQKTHFLRSEFAGMLLFYDIGMIIDMFYVGDTRMQGIQQHDSSRCHCSYWQKSCFWSYQSCSKVAYHKSSSGKWNSASNTLSWGNKDDCRWHIHCQT